VGIYQYIFLLATKNKLAKRVKLYL